jgi:sulfur-oxidizing protein SoxY
MTELRGSPAHGTPDPLRRRPPRHSAPIAGLVLALIASSVPAAAPPAGPEAPAPQTDPLGSPRWEDLRKAYFGDTDLVFDERVKVTAPEVAEDALDVAVSVDATGLTEIREILVLADFNPFPEALRFTPGQARASLGFQMKLDQSTPIRAAVRTADGVWHLGGTRVQTTGGGCNVASGGAGGSGWEDDLNQVTSRVSARPDGGRLLRLEISHPMDTGLAAGVPIFYIETVEITDAAGQRLMLIEPGVPVATNPIFTLDIPAGAIGEGPVQVSGRDNNGNLIAAEINP